MIVEDDPAISSVLRCALEDEGYRVEAESNGCAALCRLADGGYSAVLLDWNLPCFSGGQLAEELQEWQGSSVPIILMSADPDWKTQRRAEWIGAKAAFCKPFDVDELLASVHAVTGGA